MPPRGGGRGVPGSDNPTLQIDEIQKSDTLFDQIQIRLFDDFYVRFFVFFWHNIGISQGAAGKNSQKLTLNRVYLLYLSFNPKFT